MSFDEETKNSFDVRLGSTSVRVLDLERIIKSKETVRRPKDLLILPVLRDTLKTLTLGDTSSPFQRLLAGLFTAADVRDA